jgi:hypothetical protein
MTREERIELALYRIVQSARHAGEEIPNCDPAEAHKDSIAVVNLRQLIAARNLLNAINGPS